MLTIAINKLRQKIDPIKINIMNKIAIN